MNKRMRGVGVVSTHANNCIWSIFLCQTCYYFRTAVPWPSCAGIISCGLEVISPECLCKEGMFEQRLVERPASWKAGMPSTPNE